MSAALEGAALDQLFRKARSQNDWIDEPLAPGAIETIWNLVSQGPTSANTEPMRIAWCVSAESKATLASYCSSANAAKVLAASATAVIGYDIRFYDKLPMLFPHTDARPWFTGSEQMIRSTAFRNGTLQAGYFIMAARAIGYDVGPMSGFDEEKVEDAFFGGIDVKVNFICSIGRGRPEKVFDRLPRLRFNEANFLF